MLYVSGIILWHRFAYICSVQTSQSVKQGGHIQVANWERSLVSVDSRAVSRMHLGECQLAGDKIIRGAI